MLITSKSQNNWRKQRILYKSYTLRGSRYLGEENSTFLDDFADGSPRYYFQLKYSQNVKIGQI